MSSEHKKIYIATTFLILGYVLNPEKNYHIEFAISNNVVANHLKECLKSFNIILKEIEKKNLLILYIKDSEQISDFLGLVNAYNAMLNMENIKIYKDVRNTVNRNVNCETANLKKTINAPLKQVEAIKKCVGEGIEFGEKAVVYYPDNNELSINGKIQSINVVFQFRSSDPSGDGVYIWANGSQLTDANLRIIGKIRDAFANWKTSIIQSDDLLDKMKKVSEK